MKGTRLQWETGASEIAFSFAPSQGAYGKVDLKLDAPVDMRGKALSFEVRSDEKPAGLYVRLYNAGEKKPVWSFIDWRGVSGKEWKRLSFEEGSGGRLQWETGVISGAPADKVVRVEIIGGEYKKKALAAVDLRIRDIQILQGTPSSGGIFGGHPKIQSLIPMSGTEVKGTPHSQEVVLSFNRKNGRYGKITFNLTTPLNLEGKRFQFNCRSLHAPTGLYVRFFNIGEKKPAWSFAMWAKVSSDSWKTFDLQREGTGLLPWEGGVVSQTKAERVDRIEFILGEQKSSEEEFDLQLKDFRILQAEASISQLPPQQQQGESTARV